MSRKHHTHKMTCLFAMALTAALPPAAPLLAATPSDTSPVANAVQSHVHGEYYCPMHPQERSDKPGRCPICGMFLVKDEDNATPQQNAATAAGSSADRASANKAQDEGKTYTCPMHPEVITHEPGRCPICGMFLVEKDDGASQMQQQHADHQHATDTSAQANNAAVATTNAQPSHKLVPKADTNAGGTIKYVCPMHPQIVMDAPGTCPICGMTLEKVEMGGQQDQVQVNVSGGMQQALALKVAKAKHQTMWRFVDTVGEVDYDESQITHIHSRVSGWVEKLTVTSAGDQIKKGQLLYELYSPELVNAQDDYLLAAESLKQHGSNSRNSELLRKAQTRLELLGINRDQIQRLEKTGKTLFRMPFYAETDGYVTELNVRDGMYLQPATEVLSMVDLHKVWVIADVFENEQSWLEVGQTAEVNIPAMGIKGLEGKIDYIYPELDPVTRSLRVRVVLDNPSVRLRPNTLAKVSIYGGANKDALVVPQEALIQTGKENRVVVKTSDQGFVAKQVTTGMMSRGQVEILSGIADGDDVVISGQFLLDSEASLKGSLLRLSAQQPQEADNAEDHH